MKGTWYAARWGGGNFKFLGTEECSANGEELNTLVISAMAKAMKINNNFKAKYTYNSENENKTEHFNSEHLNIETNLNYEWGKSHREWLSQPKSCAEHTFNQHESYSISKIINPDKTTKN